MPKDKNISETIKAKGVEISILSSPAKDDYISLTDMAKYRNAKFPADVVKNWFRLRNTIDYLGLWETLNNPNFNMVEFDQFKYDTQNNQNKSKGVFYGQAKDFGDVQEFQGDRRARRHGLVRLPPLRHGAPQHQAAVAAGQGGDGICAHGALPAV